jgi:hypothetical protein
MVLFSTHGSEGGTMSKRRWTRVLVFVGVVVMIAGTAPATAAPGGKPGPPASETVTVTLSYDGHGIATTEECGGALTMDLDGESLFMSWDDTSVEMNFGPLSGCHGPLFAGSDDYFSGNFTLAQQRDGTVNLSSRFDYEWQYETIKNRQVQGLLDFYSINGYLTPSDDFAWSPGGGGTLSGSLLLKHFHKVYKDGEWTEIGTFDVTITVTIGSRP